MTGMLLAALDQTIVSTALKNIVEEFNGLNHYTWVVTAYLLTSTAATPLYGKISDLYGRRIVFQFAIVTFLIGSALAGASQNMGQLIATRALQGLGAGGLMALTFVIISVMWFHLANVVATKVTSALFGGSHQLLVHYLVDTSQIITIFLESLVGVGFSTSISLLGWRR
jgi:MFS family permease